ncbi:MAG: hypothetical protein ACM3VY_00255 [Candidatus Bathyarchaeota archaeon]
MQIPFVGAAYESSSLNFDAQRCVNLYPEFAPAQPPLGMPTAKSPAKLVGTPGRRLWKTLPGAGGLRALYRASTDVLIAVQGSSVFIISPDGTATAAGTINSYSGPVSIVDNGGAAALADGQAWSVGLAPGSVVQPLGTTATRVAFIDGYFIFNTPGTQQFYISNIDSAVLSPADYASVEGWPDKLVSLVADHRELWLFGDLTTEVWFDSGDVNFPFSRIQGAFIEVGIAAAASVAKCDNSLFWLGRDERGAGMVWRANGYTPVRVSTHALEQQFAGYSTISDAIGFSYQQGGHQFYVLTFPSADRTWVFDAATGLWHERAYHDANGAQHAVLDSCFAMFLGLPLVGDRRNGNIYVLDPATYADNGDAIHRIRSTPHASNPDYRWMFWRSLQVDMETGVGLQAGQGSDPQAMLQWSDDGGHTWSNERWASLGKVGKYRTRARWRRLGKSRDRVYRLTITDPVKVEIFGASAEVEMGAV